MTTYRVTHRRNGRCYHLRAETPGEAIERLTLVLTDLEGKGAWKAAPEADREDLADGTVLDEAGKPVRSLQA